MSLGLWRRDPFSTGWNDMDDFGRMTRDMDRMFGLTRGGGQQLGGQEGGVSSALWRPMIDVKETDKEVMVHADLPGIKKEDINIELNDNVLTISGERKYEKKEENERFHRSERSYGKFVRSMQVPEGIKEQDIKAKFDNGVLELSFPKPAEQKKEAKRITIG